MTLRFYRGGPVAVCHNFTSFWVTENGVNGCDVARYFGADIPRDTYREADPAFSQFDFEGVGVNYTALLPVEE